MISRFLSFLKQPTSKQVLINTIGNYLNVIFTAFFAFFLVRVMNPVEYGVLSVLLGIAYVLANILDFGISATIYSYVPILIENDQKKLFRFLKTTFTIQSFFAFIIVGLLFIFFPWLDQVFFKTHAPWWELYLTTFSVVFLIWQNYAINLLLAAKRIFQAQLFLNLSNLLKTATIFLLTFLKIINIATVIFVFGILGPILFFLFLFFEKKHLFLKLIKAEIRKEEFKFSYTLTYFIASQFFYLGTRMDLFLLSFYFPNTPQVGYYGLSTKIILTLFASISSITQVLSPLFANLKNKDEIKPLLKKSLAYCLIPTGLFIFLFLTPDKIFFIAFTEKFSQTAAITKSLALAYILYPLANIPLLFLLYTVKKPKYILFGNLIFFIFVTLGCYFLIPIKEVYGPPAAIFLAIFVEFIYLSFISLRIKTYPKFG